MVCANNKKSIHPNEYNKFNQKAIFGYSINLISIYLAISEKVISNPWRI
ncbi:hypothetical protein M2132_000402 [Dysgonomonas sp. PH5-45]|nr:hypothetical protein [Dysgonomonas sp. PH5-45]MDH6387069.1 hypothetical protein [Dysgonomonas sp. PH5-37]